MRWLVQKIWFAAGTLPLMACNPTLSETQINARVLSPDNMIEAVYSEELSEGAATGVSQDVYIVPRGRFPRLVDRVFTNECVHDVKLRWLDNRTIEISYSVPKNIHEDTSRAPPAVWWAPWLWGNSLSRNVRLRLTRTLLPLDGC